MILSQKLSISYFYRICSTASYFLIWDMLLSTPRLLCNSLVFLFSSPSQKQEEFVSAILKIEPWGHKIIRLIIGPQTGNHEIKLHISPRWYIDHNSNFKLKPFSLLGAMPEFFCSRYFLVQVKIGWLVVCSFMA